jgi:hypothetical protein
MADSKTTRRPTVDGKPLPGVTVDKAVYEYIVKEAEQEDRPVSNHLRRILREYVATKLAGTPKSDWPADEPT